jgi:hypothetical protein
MQEEVNTRYLSLALDTRVVIDVLVAFVKNTDTARLQPLVSRVVASLDCATDRDRLFSSAQRRSLFGDYERMETLEVVQKEFPTQNLGAQLKALLEESSSADAKKHNAEQAIQFLCALEGKALERYTEAMDM